MKTFILIFFLSTGSYNGSVAIKTINFSNLSACEEAKSKLPIFKNFLIYGICVEK